MKALVGQPPFAPGAVEAFLNDRRIAVLSYVRADGRPNQTPIWYTLRNGTFFMTTTTGGAKHRAIDRDPNICLTIQDERPPYRAVIADGVASLTDLDAADDPTEGMATRYFGRLGAASYDRMTSEIYNASGMTLITLVPTGVRVFDNTQGPVSWGSRPVRIRNRLPLPRRWL